MRPPATYTALETFGRARLSRHFQARNFLYSEIANFFGRPNLPQNPDRALAAGQYLAETLLDPLVETFGPIDIRAGYRSPSLNHFGATEVRPQKCSANEKNRASRIWDETDAEGRMGATVTVAIPWFADQYNRGRDWRDLAWWLWDHLDFHEVWFFPKDAAFNLQWREEPEKRILGYIAPKGLLASRDRPPPSDRGRRYEDFPPFRGIDYPPIPETWT